MRKGILALESISFQGPAFFEELTRSIEACKGADDNLLDEAYFTSPSVGKVLAVIKKHTDLQYAMLDGRNSGPATQLPMLTGSNVLFSRAEQETFKDLMGFDLQKDIRPLTLAMKKKVIDGGFDLKTAKVNGVFAKMQFDLYMPRDMLTLKSRFTASEVAAIVLHEVGHTFTLIEFISRSVSTNQVLAGMTRAMDKTVPEESRKIVFAAGSDLLRMTEEQQKALLNAKDAKVVSCVVLDASIALSVSELGFNVYDTTACEYLADQFATRCGAGKDLVTALDKLWARVEWREAGLGSWLVQACQVVFLILGFLALTYYTLGLIWIVILFDANRSAAYDSDKSRILRIKAQNTQRLKNQRLSAKEKQALLDANAAIETIAKFHDDNLHFIGKVVYYLKPSYRNAYKFELLQKDLELLGNNSLFDSATKFTLA